MRKVATMRRTLFCVLFSIVASLVGCSDDKVTKPAVVDQYDVGATLFLAVMDPPEVDVFVTRITPGATAARACAVEINGVSIPPRYDSTDDQAVYTLEVPDHVPGTQYAAAVHLPRGTVTCTLISPAVTPTLTLTAPQNNAQFVPGQAILVQWQYTGAEPDELEINLGTCAAVGDSDYYSHQALANATSGTYTIPTSATTALNVCEGVDLTVIARNTGAIESSLVSESSRWFVVLGYGYRSLLIQGP